MNEIKIMICDVSVAGCQRLSCLIERQFKEHRYKTAINYCNSGKELLTLPIDYDLLFLEIDMPHMDGIEAGKHLRKLGWQGKLVMMTATSNRFKETFQNKVFRYISKPFSEKEITEVLRDFQKTLFGQNILIIHENGNEYQIKQCEIMYLESRKEYLRIYYAHKVHEIRESLCNIKKKLDPRLFFLCHRSYIVNLNMVKSFIKEDSHIHMENENIIPVSRRRIKSFCDAYAKYTT